MTSWGTHDSPYYRSIPCYGIGCRLCRQARHPPQLQNSKTTHLRICAGLRSGSRDDCFDARNERVVVLAEFVLGRLRHTSHRRQGTALPSPKAQHSLTSLLCQLCHHPNHGWNACTYFSFGMLLPGHAYCTCITQAPTVRCVHTIACEAQPVGTWI